MNKNSKFFKHSNLGLIVVSCFIGIISLSLFVYFKKEPAKSEAGVESASVTVFNLEPFALRQTIEGYGLVVPGQRWKSISSVKGRVIESHPHLRNGEFIQAGEVLYTIDPSQYELKVAEIKAQQERLTAEKKTIELDKRSTESLLRLEKNKLKISEKELSRLKGLVKNGVVSQSNVDKQERETIAQQKAVLSLENSLSLIPSKLSAINADIKRYESLLEQSLNDLADTKVSAPFDIRIESENINLHQEVKVGETLITAYGIDYMEVEVNFPLNSVRRLLKSTKERFKGVSLSQYSNKVFESIEVGLSLVGNKGSMWSGEVERIKSELNPQTRTAQFVIKVDSPFNINANEHRVPLQPGMYVRVSLSNKLAEQVIAIPRHLIRNNTVKVLHNNQLQSRSVTVAFEQEGIAVISEGLSAGDLVITDFLQYTPDGTEATVKKELEQETYYRNLGIKNHDTQKEYLND